jgi:predicted transglutaminase-like cysteine proteinase
MTQIQCSLSICLLFAGLATGCAQSNQVGALVVATEVQSNVAASAAPPGIGSKIKFGQTTAIPDGYYEMCVTQPSLCRIRSGQIAASPDGGVKKTNATTSQLASVNADVNATIHPVHRDGWMPGRTSGDCKDFALTKRQRLPALPVAVVRTLSGEQHLILVARMNQGDFVLDNLTQSIVPWSSAPYTWEKIQSTTNVWAWLTIRVRGA